MRPGRLRIRMSFPADLAGDIPFHCHLVDHEDNGRMGVISVTSISGCGAKTKHNRADTFVHQEIVTEPFSIFCPLPIRYFAVTSNSVEVRGTVLFL